jgi:hypothetical protein
VVQVKRNGSAHEYVIQFATNGGLEMLNNTICIVEKAQTQQYMQVMLNSNIDK